MHDVVVTEGGRYQFVKEQGMRITNITTADDGEYTCRAEVDSDGRYDERKINVSVHSKSIIVAPSSGTSSVCSLLPRDTTQSAVVPR